MRPTLVLFLFTTCFRLTAADPADLKSITQYGITWTFDKAYPAGQFVTGDWWVVGPVKVVGISPAPGIAPADEPVTDGKSIYGAEALQDDKRLRNGSMLFSTVGKAAMSFDGQGYDSRIKDFDPKLSHPFPCDMAPGQSLISTISGETYKDGKLTTPFVPSQELPALVGGLGKPELPLALETAAILTCLDRIPPPDAFRSSYIGRSKTIYRAKDIRWDLLPNLKPVAATPDFKAMTRLFERPWLDHDDSWMIQFSGPGLNQPNYGGVFANLTTTAGLMLLLDVPREQKEKLMIGYLQLGIDLHGLAECGRQWFSDGGHWMGRKFPILFTSVMLDSAELRTFPEVDFATARFHGKYQGIPAGDGAPHTTIFQEDLDTYYGQGSAGQNVLWQVTYHTRPRQPIMEKSYNEWNEDQKFANKYYWIAGNWSGIALASMQMKMKETWNHDAFFDFCDWFMLPGQIKIDPKGESAPARNNTSPFVQQMWDAYRSGVPAQPGGKDNLKWVWLEGKVSDDGQKYSASKGQFVPNPKPK